MSAQLAPFNNAMRLGQGFNSYTQQICLNGAVLPPSKTKTSPNSVDDQVIPRQQDARQQNAQEGNPTGPVIMGSNAEASPSAAQHTGPASADQGQVVPPMSAPPPLPSMPAPSVRQGAGVSQIVSYSSRFVDKLSDITDAMNISASLSIKTATVGGKASGSFVDSDKFKQSDMNFFVQVKVVNQVIMGEDYTEFQDLDIPADKFTDIYGDHFISGFEQGGELNALISVKVSDKNKTFAVKAELEAALGTPALSGKVSGGVKIENSSIEGSTETTVTVNWSGGGQIKPENAKWDVQTLTLAAANFPENVASTPQYTHAILSKYSTLKSFAECYTPQSVMAYENAGIYTAFLLDTYMDYKAIWKQIQIANSELKNRRAEMCVAKPPKDMIEDARQRTPTTAGQGTKAQSAAANPPQSFNVSAAQPAEPANKTLAPGTNNSAQEPVPISASNAVTTVSCVRCQAQTRGRKMPKGPKSVPSVPVQNTITFDPYPATIMGLDRARRDCRNEMIKIVSEVDEITKDPSLALNAGREDRLVSPRVFSHLLPLVTLRAVETDQQNSAANPRDLLILGETAEPPRLQQWLYNRSGNESSPEPYPTLLSSIEKHKGRSKTFDMGDAWSGSPSPPKAAVFFNDLDQLNETFLPKSISLWMKDDIIIAIKTFYTKGEELGHGPCHGTPTHIISIDHEGATFATQMTLESATPKGSIERVRALQIMLDSCKTLEQPPLGRAVADHADVSTLVLMPPSSGIWSFRGFYGSMAPLGNGITALGVVWGLDDAKLRSGVGSASGATGLGDGDSSSLVSEMLLGRKLPEKVLLSLQQRRELVGKFAMSDSLGEYDTTDPNLDFFTDLSNLQPTWKLRGIRFYTHNSKSLCGYRLAYENGPPITRGFVPSTAPQELIPATEWLSWKAVRLLSTTTAGGLQAVKGIEIGTSFTQQKFEFVAPDGPFKRQSTFSSPGDEWRLAGFWGFYDRTAKELTQLGVIWGEYPNL